MKYKDYPTVQLAEELKNLSSEIFDCIDYGEPVEDFRDDIKRLVDGSIELWMRSMKK